MRRKSVSASCFLVPVCKQIKKVCQLTESIIPLQVPPTFDTLTPALCTPPTVVVLTNLTSMPVPGRVNDLSFGLSFFNSMEVW